MSGNIIKFKNKKITNLIMKFYVTVFSPRWGRDDRYTIEIKENGFSLYLDHRGAEYDSNTGKWSGYNEEHGNPLLNLLHNDHIYTHEILSSALVWVWEKWKNSEIDDAEVKSAFKELFDWVNGGTKARPTSELLNQYL